MELEVEVERFFNVGMMLLFILEKDEEIMLENFFVFIFSFVLWIL